MATPSVSSGVRFSSTSWRFSAGRMMVVTPARRAARNFSLMPPTGSTLPLRVISPVMAVSGRTGVSVNSETSTVVMVTPADGPSLGIAPPGERARLGGLPRRHVNVQIDLAREVFVQTHAGRVRSHPGQRRLHRLLHHLADLPGHVESALALHLVGFDEENVAAGRRPGQTHSHARPLHAFGDLGFHAHLNATEKFLENVARHSELFRLPF